MFGRLIQKFRKVPKNSEQVKSDKQENHIEELDLQVRSTLCQPVPETPPPPQVQPENQPKPSTSAKKCRKSSSVSMETSNRNSKTSFDGMWSHFDEWRNIFVAVSAKMSIVSLGFIPAPREPSQNYEVTVTIEMVRPPTVQSTITKSSSKTPKQFKKLPQQQNQSQNKSGKNNNKSELPQKKGGKVHFENGHDRNNRSHLQTTTVCVSGGGETLEIQLEQAVTFQPGHLYAIQYQCRKAPGEDDDSTASIFVEPMSLTRSSRSELKSELAIWRVYEGKVVIHVLQAVRLAYEPNSCPLSFFTV